MQDSTTPSGGLLAEFVNQHRAKVIGVLEGFDRVRVRITWMKRRLSYS
jgi:hypothetical protein